MGVKNGNYQTMEAENTLFIISIKANEGFRISPETAVISLLLV